MREEGWGGRSIRSTSCGDVLSVVQRLLEMRRIARPFTPSHLCVKACAKEGYESVYFVGVVTVSPPPSVLTSSLSLDQ